MGGEIFGYILGNEVAVIGGWRRLIWHTIKRVNELFLKKTTGTNVASRVR